MRSRPLVALSVVASATLLLAGCSTAEAEPAPTDTPAAADFCDAAMPTGPVSEGVTVEGELGQVSTATFDLEQSVTEVERTVLTEGDGDVVADGDYVTYALSAFNGDTGERLGDAGYNPAELLPAEMGADTSIGTLIGCVPVGSRLSVVLPGDETNPAQFYIVDVLDIVPSIASGEEQPPVEGMPTVSLDDTGVPTVTVPDAAPPADLQIAVLKKGDGPEVAEGDTTMVQYTGVQWDTGEEFDTSWDDRVPMAQQGNPYVPGFVQAMTGQTVGSQVLVVIPPALAYGAEESPDNELAGKTLVFVIDIIGTQHAAPVQ